MVKLEDIQNAYKRIEDFIHHTPVFTNSHINRLAGAEIYFKCENLQKTGSFKIRGASNAVFMLPETEAARGVITHSSGNHGAALAQAARWRGIKAYVVMPRNAPEIKKKAARHYGAEIVFSEATLESREAVSQKLIDEKGLSLVHPYDNPNVIAGQGTVLLEFQRAVPDIEMVVVPAGGGGILSGTAVYAREALDNVRVFGAEPRLADDAYQSFKTGIRQPQRPPVTVADGLRTALSDRTFNIIRRYVEDILLTEDEEIISAMRMAWERMKLVIEPSSIAPLAAILKNKERFAGKKVGVIITGGNVDLDQLPWLETSSPG